MNLWVLGAPDPEMEAIETILHTMGERVAYATCEGNRVSARTAYQADRVALPPGCRTLIWVECAQADGRATIDHHRPGDVGYGRHPANFLHASSIGQVISRLARDGKVCPEWDRGQQDPEDDSEPGDIWLWPDRRSAAVVLPAGETREISFVVPLIAAADHCLGAAYAGQCPGIDPEELRHWRVATRAEFQGRSIEDVLADVIATTKALQEAPQITLLGPADWTHTEEHDWSSSVCDGCARESIVAADMRREPPWPELPEAATYVGMAYISGPLAAPDGRRKITCSGTAEVIRAFMETWAPAQGLVDLYGDPARGFAGGYLP
ncbi:MAG: hypothetical protein HYZ29_25965 [Myxococcales bacterium]|nr:hypothetical protein [Myxococcales bacterium]